MKKRLNLIFLITIIAGSSITFLSLINNPIFDIEKDSEVNQEKEKNEDVFNPETSTPDWFSIDKPQPLVAGTQDNTWDETNLRNNDSLVDSTNFAQGSSYSLLRDTCNPCTVPSYTGEYGSTPDGLWWFTDAYKDDDGDYLFLRATRGIFFNENEYPGWIHMTWGEYAPIPEEICPHIYSISIDYEVWADSSPGILDESTDLNLWVWADRYSPLLLIHQIYTIEATPAHRNHYEDTWTITSGPVFDWVKGGGFIKHVSVQMYCNEEIGTYTWLNVDYIKINYNYYKFDVDFEYVLDYGTTDLDFVTEFELQIDMEETVPFATAYLFDYGLSAYIEVGFVQSIGLNTILINTDADHYFDSSGEMKLKIARYDYHDEWPSSGYQIKVDMVKVNILPPDPPPNVEVDQGIHHIYLTWDTPEDYGVPITHYTVYRGLVEGGVKDFLGTTTTNYYNDTTATINVRYYYVISATNIVEEGANSSEVSGKAYDQPFIEFLDPIDGDTIIFPYNKTDQFAHWVMFDFKYDWVELDDAELVIGVINHGSVWDKNRTLIFPYQDGPVTVTLNGYNNSILVASHIISLTFVRIEFEIEEMLDFGTEIHGDKLYLILHDPHGDQSYSGFTETSTLSIGFGYKITNEIAGHISVGAEFDLFGVELGASIETTTTETEEEGFDFRLEMTETTSITSNKLGDNPDYIGPGYGDIYWGESWIYKWVLNATYREYSNNTEVYEEPRLLYGILRGVETLASDVDAPQEWRDQNPIHNDWVDVSWGSPLYCTGGSEKTALFEVSGTLTRTHSFTVTVEAAAAASIGIANFGLEGSIEITEATKSYSEVSLGHSSATSYRVFDNENTDRIVQGVGIDNRFGTYIFNSSSLFCETSQPLEHNTFDYIPPEIMFPYIDYDSNNDFQGPCSDDSPIITVDLFDEGGIREALIKYSIDNGSGWDFVYLIEDINFAGTWSAPIPAQEVDTEVQWYVICWDIQGANSTKKNGTGEPFKYTVVSKVLTPPPEIPGYPLMPIAYFSIIALISIIIVFQKKRRKYYQ